MKEVRNPSSRTLLNKFATTGPNNRPVPAADSAYPKYFSLFYEKLLDNTEYVTV
jgi:hypothetical protein